MTVSVKAEKSGQTESVKVNDTNASTSCADNVKLEDKKREDKNNLIVRKFKPRKFVKESDKCVCACGKSVKQNLSSQVGSQTSFGP